MFKRFYEFIGLATIGILALQLMIGGVFSFIIMLILLGITAITQLTLEGDNLGFHEIISKVFDNIKEGFAHIKGLIK